MREKATYWIIYEDNRGPPLLPLFEFSPVSDNLTFFFIRDNSSEIATNSACYIQLINSFTTVIDVS